MTDRIITALVIAACLALVTLHEQAGEMLTYRITTAKGK